MSFRVAYISYADYGGPLVHTKEFVKAFREIVPDLITHCPFFDKELSYGGRSGPETFFNKLFLLFPSWARQFKLGLYQSRKLLRDLAKWSYFAGLYRENNIDIVVVRNDAYVIGPIYAANNQCIPYLLETNGILSKDKPGLITELFEKYVFSKASGIFAVSDPLAQLLITFGIPKSKIRVIPNGVDLDSFQSFKKSIIPSHLQVILQDKIIICYVGTFTENHNVSEVIRGFAQALSTMPNLRLLLIGEGKLDQKIKDEVSNLGIRGETIFTGKIPHDHVPAYIQLSHIMVNPMKQVYEEAFIGVPIKMFEYMAAKRPIVSTDMPNLRQLLNDAAIFVPPSRPDKWAEAFIRLASDTKLCEEKGKQAFDHLKKRGYTWEENARKVYDFCKDIITCST